MVTSLHDRQINMAARSLSRREWFLVLSSSQSNYTKVLVLLLAQYCNRLNGLRTTLFLRPTFAQHPFNFCLTNVGQMLKPFKRALTMNMAAWITIGYFSVSVMITVCVCVRNKVRLK